MRNLAVGQVLDLGHIDNGMVVTSMAGYPLTLQLNPFRMNNINISLTSYNMYYKNGVVHTLLEYPRPLAPWVGKTMYDVLLETNSKRNGDLSDFIAIIDALPEIVVLMQDNSVTATTLFVPTNEAIAVLLLLSCNSSFMSGRASMMAMKSERSPLRLLFVSSKTLCT